MARMPLPATPGIQAEVVVVVSIKATVDQDAPLEDLEETIEEEKEEEEAFCDTKRRRRQEMERNLGGAARVTTKIEGRRESAIFVMFECSPD